MSLISTFTHADRSLRPERVWRYIPRTLAKVRLASPARPLAVANGTEHANTSKPPGTASLPVQQASRYRAANSRWLKLRTGLHISASVVLCRSTQCVLHVCGCATLLFESLLLSQVVPLRGHGSRSHVSSSG